MFVSTLVLLSVSISLLLLSQESDSESESDGIGTDLDEDGDLELRLARLEHLLERRPVLVKVDDRVLCTAGKHMSGRGGVMQTGS